MDTIASNTMTSNELEYLEQRRFALQEECFEISQLMNELRENRDNISKCNRKHLKRKLNKIIKNLNKETEIFNKRFGTNCELFVKDN